VKDPRVPELPRKLLSCSMQPNTQTTCYLGRQSHLFHLTLATRRYKSEISWKSPNRAPTMLPPQSNSLRRSVEPRLSHRCVRMTPHRNCDAGGKNATRESNQEWSETRARRVAVPLGRQRALWETHLPKESDRHSLPISRCRFCPQSSNGIAARTQRKCSPAMPAANDHR